MKPAVVLLSGGLDSSTCLALAKSQGFDCHALSFDYGQRQRQELAAAQTVAQTIGVASHRILNLDMRAIGGSALTSDMAVPKHRSADEIGHGIPVTYVPARNTIFLSYALGLAEVLKANDIFIGVNALDYSGYPDCRPAFIQAFQTMANLATAAGVSGQSPMTIHTPLIDMTKAQIVRTALDLGLDIDMTFSCYDPSADGEPCGACDACLLRAKGIAEAQST
ncbi:MAG: 7-cyano-7-deazaguanine synthase QueC [Burkholderiaceae bacterium]